MVWHPTNEEIEYWLDAKTLAFAQEESVGMRVSIERWLDDYIYSDIHEIFVEFPVLLHEWLVGLASRRTNYQTREINDWSNQLVQEITSVSNVVSRAVDFWVDSILQGYIIDFAIYTITLYSEVEQDFFQGPRRRYLLSISTWIKLLGYEKGLLHLDN